MFSSREMSKLGTWGEDGGFRAGTNWQRRGSTGEPRLWLSLPSPESKSAEVTKRLSTSWLEDNCGRGSKLEGEASGRALKSRLKAPLCAPASCWAVVTSSAQVLNLPLRCYCWCTRVDVF